MTVHLFGGTWSPSCCSFALHRAAEDRAEDYHPETLKIVARNFYVDDCLKSVQDPQQAVQLVEELRSLLAQAGFKIRKWVSNSPLVKDSIPVEDHSKRAKERDLDSPLEERAPCA